MNKNDKAKLKVWNLTGQKLELENELFDINERAKEIRKEVKNLDSEISGLIADPEAADKE